MSLYSSPPSSRSTELFTPPHVLPPFSSSSFRSPCLSLPPPSSPFPHLFHHSSAPFLSSCPSFFLSLCYSLLFPLLTLLLRPSFFFLVPAPCFVFVSSVLSPSLRHSVSVHLRLPLCSCALFPRVLLSNVLCSLSTSPSSCLFSMFSRLFLFTLFRFSCAGVYAILSCTLSYHRRLPYASFIFVNFIVLSLELLSLLSVQRLARLSASRLFLSF